MKESTTGPVAAPSEPQPQVKKRDGVSLRALFIGIVATALIDYWLHYAELYVSASRGHSALSNTSIPIGAFNVLFALVLINLVITKLAPSLRLNQGELMTIYVMSAVSTVLSSSGGIHFLVPTITAAHYFATPENAWGSLFLKYIPKWVAQTDPVALKAFYEGGSGTDLHRWAEQIAVWSGFLILFACSTLCLTMMLRKQWIEREHLPFPTVQLPLELAKDQAPLLTDKIFWLGVGIPLFVAIVNTLGLNHPNVPMINLRAMALGDKLVDPPWNALAGFKITFFPFVIGIGYLLSTEVVFSCWFFYLVSQVEAVWGAAIGVNAGGATTTVQSSFPWLSYQGAGAFFGLALFSIWVSKRHLKEVFQAAFRGVGDDWREVREYKVAVFGLILCSLGMVVFAWAAGATAWLAIVFVILTLVYLMAATRLRAETGNAWPVGPDVDAFRLLMVAGGTKIMSPADVTTLTYLRAATAGQDFRGTCMPHELDGLKVAEATGTNPRKMAWAMALAIALGVVISFVIALSVWNHYGALAKTNAWRSLSGRARFQTLEGFLRNPTPPDKGGMFGIGLGLGITMLLAYLRMSYSWWPFHPVGFCMSNLSSASSSWFPFFLAWLAKVVITKAGGMKLYRRLMPFFFGLIAGDLLAGGLTTLLACLTPYNVMPVNW